MPGQPAEEQRGGTRPDWDNARPGRELPQLPEPEQHDPPVPAGTSQHRRLRAVSDGGGCGNPRCEAC